MKKLQKQKLIRVILLLIVILSIFNIYRVGAKDNSLVISSVILNDKSNGVETKISNYENNEIDSNIVYHKLNDYVEYKITIKNNEEKELKINSINVDSPYKYIVYEYDKNEGTILGPKESKDIIIKAEYKNEAEYNGSSNEDAKLNISYVIDGTEKTTIVPFTNDNIYFHIALLVISSITLISIIVFKKKNKKIALVMLLLVPVITRALNVNLSLSFKNDIKIQDKQTVKYNVDGKDENKIIPYGSKVEKPSDPYKEGYTFLGWFENDNLYSFDREIKDDVKIEARFEAKNVKYKVIYKLENIDNDEYYTTSEEELPGKYDEEVTPVVKNYDGYKSPEIQKVSIKYNTQIVYEYKRNTHKVRYSYTNTKLPSDASQLPSEVTYKYGAQVNIAPSSTASGYSFEWNKDNTFTMPDNDVEVTGTFTAQMVGYKVEHYMEQSNGEFKLLDENIENKQGLTDTTATATPKENLEMYIYDNTIDSTISSANIKGDSSLVLKLYYRLKTHTLKFNANGGTTSETLRAVKYNETIESLPTAEKENLHFVGWFTKPTGVNDSNQVFADTVLTEDMEVYAHYKGVVCKRATSLHGTYGTIQEGDTIKAGDAFDCDVNGDGEYNADKERFYYIRTDDNNNAVLIYSNITSAELPNYTDGCPSTGREYAYINNNTYRSSTVGPVTTYTEIPDKSTWSNVFLSNNGTRDIYYGDNKYVTTFTYENRAGRYLTFQELEIICGEPIEPRFEQTLPSKCNNFLQENLNTGCRSNFFLETPANSNGLIFRIYNDNSLKANPRSATKPVIEVPYELLELDSTQKQQERLVVHDIMHPAMRTYYDNIDSWTEGQTEENHSNYDTQMLNNLKAYNCAYTGSENDRNFYVTGSKQYCDQPNKYDTGVRDEIKVYESDENTREKGSEATYVTASNGYIYNMIPGVTYYWEKESDSNIHGFVKASGERRIISIDNEEKLSSSPKIYKVRNVRDLGGIRVSYQDENNNTVNGTIKYQKLYRGEKIWGGDGQTKALFDKLGINHELDLRAPSEAKSGAAEEDRLEYNVTRGSLLTFEANNYVVRYDTERSNYYRTREAITKVMQEFVDAANNGDDNYSMYFHCRIGNDRTGTVAYMLEGLLGASPEERYRDFELSYFFGFTMRNRFYEASQDGSRHTKFNYLKKAVRDAGDGVNEDALAWYLIGSSDTTSDMNLIQQFRKVMVQVD